MGSLLVPQSVTASRGRMSAPWQVAWTYPKDVRDSKDPPVLFPFFPHLGWFCQPRVEGREFCPVPSVQAWASVLTWVLRESQLPLFGGLEADRHL